MQIPDHDLPLFPLNTVLFPRMPLPLHIFEPRYLEMITRCLEEEIGFGVMLIKEGAEVGTTALPHAVGTVARIVDSASRRGGTLDILAMGVVRLRLLETRTTHPYLSGDIARWEDEMGDLRALPRLTQRAHKAYIQYIGDLMELMEWRERAGQIVAPLDPQVLSYTIAANLQIPNEEKQLLLELPTVADRLGEELRLLERERDFIARIKTMRSFLPNHDEGLFSIN